MSQLKVLVVEDEMVIAMDLTDKLEEMGYEVLETVASYDEAILALNRAKPDIAILDIQLEGKKTGIDLGEYLRTEHQIPFIYLTSNADKRTMNDAKATQPFAFLRKPFQHDDLYNAIEIAVHNFQSISPEVGNRPRAIVREAIFVKNKNYYEKVTLASIVYLKADHVYVEIYTEDDTRRLIRGSLSEFLETLPSHFVRVHRSYGVNLDQIKSVGTIEVTMHNREKVPLSKTYREDLMQLLGIDS